MAAIACGTLNGVATTSIAIVSRSSTPNPFASGSESVERPTNIRSVLGSSESIPGVANAPASVRPRRNAGLLGSIVRSSETFATTPAETSDT